MNIKLIAVPAVALAAGISLGACGTTHTVIIKAAPTITHTVTAPAPKPTTPKATPKPKAAKGTTPAPAQALPTVDTNNTIDSGPQAVEPSAIYLQADGNGNVTGITWSSWTVNGAEGSGSINVNNCQPYCAVGTTVEVPVSVALSSPLDGSFTAMTLTDRSGNTNTYAASSNGSLSVVSNALYTADEPPAAAAPTQSPATITSTPCTTIAGLNPGGLPGHLDTTGFCWPDGSNGVS